MIYIIKGLADKWTISSGFTYKGITYGPGERIPDGITEKELEEKWVKGFVKKINERGVAIEHPRLIEIAPSKIENMMKKGEKFVLQQLNAVTFTQETLEIMYAYSQDRRFNISKPVVALIESKLLLPPPEEELTVVGPVEEKIQVPAPKKEEKKEVVEEKPVEDERVKIETSEDSGESQSKKEGK